MTNMIEMQNPKTRKSKLSGEMRCDGREPPKIDNEGQVIFSSHEPHARISK